MPIEFAGLEKALGLADGSLTELNNSEESKSVDLSHLKVFKVDDYNTLQENNKTEIEEIKSYSNQTGRELQLKELKESLGLDFEGNRRDPNNLIEAIKSMKMDGVEGSKDYLELQEKLKAHEKGLSDYQIKLEEEQNRYVDLQNSIKADKDNSLIDSTLTNVFKEYEKEATLSIDDAKVLYRNIRNLKLNEDSIQLYEGDNLLKDELKNPLSLEDDAKAFIQKYIKKPEGGRAGDESFSSEGKMSVDKYTEIWDKANPNGLKTDFNESLMSKIKKGEIE